MISKQIPFADKLSEEIYYNLLCIEEEKDITYLLKAVSLSGFEPDPAYEWYKTLQEMSDRGTKLIFYGLGETAKSMQKVELERRNSPGYLYYPFLGNIDWFGICDQNPDKYPEGFLGKKVMSPKELFLLKEENILICIGTPDFYEEIERELINSGFPKGKIVRHIYPHTVCYEEKQYFDDFMNARNETIVIDGGCFRCDSLERFINWNKAAGKKYEKIISYEPDFTNYEICKKMVNEKHWENIELIHAGLSDKTYNCNFVGNGDDTSYVSNNGTESIQMLSIDENIMGQKVSFIKLDVEGFELKALKGARECIKRNHPRMAISLYHKKEDLMDIPKYILELSKNYKFYLRIYSNAYLEIILYAV